MWVGDVHHFKFDPVRVCEENGIRARHVVVFAWRIEYASSMLLQLLCQFIDLGTAITFESNLTQTNSVFMKGVRGKTCVSFLDPEAARIRDPSLHRPEIMTAAGIADPR